MAAHNSNAGHFTGTWNKSHPHDISDFFSAGFQSIPRTKINCKHMQFTLRCVFCLLFTNTHTFVKWVAVWKANTKSVWKKRANTSGPTNIASKPADPLSQDIHKCCVQNYASSGTRTKNDASVATQVFSLVVPWTRRHYAEYAQQCGYRHAETATQKNRTTPLCHNAQYVRTWSRYRE